MSDIVIDNPGFSLDVASWSDACMASNQTAFDYLMSHEFASDQAVFPGPFRAGDILLVGPGVSAINGFDAPKLNIERHESEVGAFVDRICIEWVKHVASLVPSDGDLLFSKWRDQYYESEEIEPDWSNLPGAALGGSLIRVSRKTIRLELDLVLVWQL